MQRSDCYSDMIQGSLDGIKDALMGISRSTNANRSVSYSFAYGDAYIGAQTRTARKRDKVAEELAISADLDLT